MSPGSEDVPARSVLNRLASSLFVLGGVSKPLAWRNAGLLWQLLAEQGVRLVDTGESHCSHLCCDPDQPSHEHPTNPEGCDDCQWVVTTICGEEQTVEPCFCVYDARTSERKPNPHCPRHKVSYSGSNGKQDS